MRLVGQIERVNVSISQAQLLKVVKWQVNHIARTLQGIEKNLDGWQRERLEPSVSSADPTFTILGSAKAERPSFKSKSIRIKLHKELNIKEHFVSIDELAYEASMLSIAPGHRLMYKAWAQKPTFSQPFIFSSSEDGVSVRRAIPYEVEVALFVIWQATVAPWDSDELDRLREARKKGKEYMAASKIELLEQEVNAWQDMFTLEMA
jgi:hypothetical protein